MMMEGVGSGEEVVAADDVHSKGKEVADGLMVLSSRERHEGSPQLFIQHSYKGKGVNNIGMSEQLVRSDSDDMVKELTLKNYPDSNSNVVEIGSSGTREGKSTKQSSWQHLCQLEGRGGREKDVMKLVKKDHFELSERLISSNKESVAEVSTVSPRSIRTKILSSSGFTQFFVKNSLNGQGVVNNCPEAQYRFPVANMNGSNDKSVQDSTIVLKSSADIDVKLDVLIPQPVAATATETETEDKHPASFRDGISVMEWLKPGSHRVNITKSLHIFRQIVEIVNHAHSRQIVLKDLRPSSFKLFGPRVKYVKSLARRELLESSTEPHLKRKRLFDERLCPYHSASLKHRRLSENVQHLEEHSIHVCNIGSQSKSGFQVVSNNVQQQSISANIIQQEEKWYTSPQELDGSGSSFSSNIYCLGVLLFELLCYFESWKVRVKAMMDLCHWVLPPSFLSEYPKEAGFCLWLLHPEPLSRPTTREILQSELICDAQECLPGSQSSLSVDEDETEIDLLLHFLESTKEQMNKQASKLIEDVGCLDVDLEDIEKRHMLRTQKSASKDSVFSKLFPQKNSVANLIENKLMKNIDQLENAYFSMKSLGQDSNKNTVNRRDKDLLQNRKRLCPVRKEINPKCNDRLGMFFDGICKYARYSTFEVQGVLRNADILSSANVICSLSFDRDQDYFAAAGVSKKIKIFDFQKLLDDSVDIHYPVIELSSKSELSCVCWNNYIKNYLASTDYDGVVRIWDASTSQEFFQYAEHNKKAWSVDFSQLDPTKLASGSDDSSVKLWTINESNSINTIPNVANVCCVQFSPYSSNLLAFGSADYKTYCFDLRNTRYPWCTLSGHGKAVSYVRFLDSETLISASIDNTLKLWDLNKTNSSGLSGSACSLTFRGHTNEKNFVGVSVSEGYIACGSETNEVYAYHRSLPMPITFHEFGSADSISGQEMSDDYGQFVSSVCWRGKSDTVVAANSSGSIKVLQMV